MMLAISGSGAGKLEDFPSLSHGHADMEELGGRDPRRASPSPPCAKTVVACGLPEVGVMTPQ
jgi:hypothetical protein